MKTSSRYKTSSLFAATLWACTTPPGATEPVPRPEPAASAGPARALDGALAAQSPLWVGNTHLRYEDVVIPAHVVMSGRPLDVFTQTYPRGSASRVELFWRDGADQVHSLPMAFDREGTGAYGNNTQWRATVAAADLLDGESVHYWIRAEGPMGQVKWDSAGGKNHRLTPRSEVVLWNGGAPDLFRHVGGGSFQVEQDALVATPGQGLGLLWARVPTPADFEVILEFRLDRPDDNSGIFLRFRDPDTFGYDNAAWAAVHDGLEVQIDETARPDGADVHRTGAFYEVPGQVFSLRAARPAGMWNEVRIRAEGSEFSAFLNGHRVSQVTFTPDTSRPLQAQPSRPGAARFFGLQSHTGHVAFRNIRLRGVPQRP